MRPVFPGGWTALTFAACSGHPGCVDLLLPVFSLRVWARGEIRLAGSARGEISLIMGFIH